MATLNVSTVSGLSSALSSAKAGDVIALAAGNYSGLVISNKNFSSGITITSSDLAHPATFVGLSISNSSGINFTHIAFSIVGVSDPYYGFRIDSSKNISFSNVDVHGDPSVAAFNQKGGFYVTYSSNIDFDNSVFEHMGAGLIANNDTGLNIANNTFTDLNKGGIEMGGSSVVTIANNTFTNFNVGAGTHPDAIQIYTAGTTTSAHDISVTGNLIERGSGDAVQGILIQDEVGNLPYQNLNIQNNVVLGGMWDSIVVNHATGNVVVANNYVASWAGLDKEGSGVDSAALYAPVMTGFAGYIWLENVSGATVTETGNTAQAYQGVAAAPAGNALIGLINPMSVSGLPLTPVSVVVQKFSGSGYGQINGNMLAGDSGSGIYAASLVGSVAAPQLISSTGTTFAGAYGSLTVSADGSFQYTQGFAGTVGVTYDDKFNLTVGSNGKAASTTVDFLITFSGVGDGKVDYITGGTAASTISGFGTGSQLTGGAGLDTYVFNSLSQSAPGAQTVIKGFKAGDVLDLSALDPKLHLVAKFDGGADELVLAHLGSGNWQVEVNTTGAAVQNFITHLVNTTADSLSFVGGKVIGVAFGAPAPAAAAPAAPVAAAPTASAPAAVIAPTPVVAVAKTVSLAEHQTMTGNALTGDTGISIALTSVGVGVSAQQAVSTAGTLFNGADGSLTVHQDGSYSYVEAKDGLTAGQVYDDHFTITATSTNGQKAVTTLDFLVTGSGTGTGGVNYITGGSAATKISGFGAGSQLTSGAGADTFVFNTLSQSIINNQTLIKSFKAGDIIDLSAIDPKFHIVSQLDRHADELVIQHLGNGNWEILGDTVGSGLANFALHLLNTTSSTISAASFHL